MSKNTDKKATAHLTDVPVRPLGDRVLIRPLKDDEKHTSSPSGILIPDTAGDTKKDRGTVVAVGPGRIDDGVRVPVEVSVGDRVMFQWGEKIEYKGQEYFLVSEGNILATY